jgi:hypothetical protein
MPGFTGGGNEDISHGSWTTHQTQKSESSGGSDTHILVVGKGMDIDNALDVHSCFIARAFTSDT